MNSENDYNHIHLLNEIRRIELLLQLRVLQFRRELQDGHENDNYRGLYISDEEIDHILKKQTSDLPTPEHDNQQRAFNENSPEVQEIKYKIKKIEKNINSIISTAVSKGVLLRFQHFCNIFSLTPFEKDVILLCLAPELDLKFEKLIAYLNDDVTRKRPTIDLTLKVLCLSRMERWNKRMAFSDSSPLYANALLSSHDPPPAPPGAVLARQLALEPNVIDHLLGGTDLDPHITPFTERIAPALNGESFNLPARLAEKLSDISRTPCLFQDVSYNIPSDTPVFYFKGMSGNGQMEVLDALCAQFRRPLLKVQLNRIAHSNISADALYKRISKDVRLNAGFVLIDGLDNTWMEGQQNQNPFSSVLIRLLCTLPCPVFVTGVSDWSPPIGKRPFISIPFPTPDFTERKLLWKKYLDDTTMNKDIDIEWISSQFRLSHTQIQQAWSSAINQFGCQSSKNQVVTTQDLNRACQIESMIDLSHSAQVISPRFIWDDIVLSKDSMEQLRDIYHHAKHRRKVYESWHFDKKSPYGNGLNILFSGTSGTGKTMAAEVIASSLELVLLKIDLSTMVSKYIGETEKNLGKVFDAASAGNVILFFDEADALFGKRSSVKDAHDRYANIEVSYLLQRMENHQGTVIMATNLESNMDTAFIRRMQFCVNFPFPEIASRLQIWEKIFPDEAPLDPGVDFDYLAKHINLAGGHIKNIAITAAFHAAEDMEKERTQTINMGHLLKAAKKEHNKLGKHFDLCDHNSKLEVSSGINPN